MPTKNQRKNDQDVEFNDFYARHQSQLYAFIAQQNSEDKQMQDTIAIKLVRIAQGGHEKARTELISLMQLTIDNWIENDVRIARWRGYEENIPSLIERCIRGYRYSGTFIGYVYRTLEYSGRDLLPLEAYSLNESRRESNRTMSELVIQNDETGTVEIFRI